MVSFRFHIIIIISGFLFFTISPSAYGQKQVLDAEMHYLRVGDQPEWADFPAQISDNHLLIRFDSQKNKTEKTLCFRQVDVKQTWKVLLNDNYLGTLTGDEKDMKVYMSVPPGMFKSDENVLRIEPAGLVTDDILFGQLVLDSRPVDQVLSEATVQVEVIDGANKKLVPSKITITDHEGILQTVEIKSEEPLAVRPGYIYTGNGKAKFGIPAGTYTIYVGRGFEYGIDSLQLEIKPGDNIRKVFTIFREVSTEGWVSCDTHIHTFTHSGHGDATVEERVLTIAGEGIELPVLTDHNKHVDINPVALEMKVDTYFTPVIGNEYTTPIGHFNIFPVTAETPPPPHQVKDWDEISKNVERLPTVAAIVLNHARDIHGGFRPFGENQHLSSAGVNLKGWKQPANAMEVINSGAQQSDLMRLYSDWFGMLNRGHKMTPVGASDSHDVGRYVVGQARTYIRSQNDEPSNIDVQEVVKNFQQGKVMVSFGLLAEITVDSTYGPGDLLTSSDEVSVTVNVSGPSWVKADRVSLYANGQKVREAKIQNSNFGGVKCSNNWILPLPKHDLFLVAIAEGPYKYLPFWPIARPYQPTSRVWEPAVFSSTGPVWIDADGDGKYSSAFTYAKELVTNYGEDISVLVKKLNTYDEAVAVQAAALLQEQGIDLTEANISAVIEQQATIATKTAFRKFLEGWHTSIKAK